MLLSVIEYNICFLCMFADIDYLPWAAFDNDCGNGPIGGKRQSIGVFVKYLSAKLDSYGPIR